MEDYIMVYQSESSDCGKACVRDIIAIQFEDEIYHHQPLKNSCSSFLEMRESLCLNGLVYASYQIDDLDAINKKQLPAIAQVKYGEIYHFVVIKKISKNSLLLDDPSFGEYEIPKEEFLLIFTHKAMLYEDKSHPPVKDKINIFPLWSKIIYFMLFLFESLSFFFCLYFINQEDALFFSIISGFLALILIFCQIILSKKIRKQFDRDIFIPYLKHTRSKDDGLALSKYLDSLLSKANRFVSYGVLAVLGCLILTSNGFYFAMMSVLAILVGILEITFKRMRNYVNHYCSIKESYFFDSFKSNNEILTEDYFASERKANKFAISYLGLKILEILFFSLLVYIYMSLINFYAINFFLFNVVLLTTIQQTTNKLVTSYLDDSEETIYLNKLSVPINCFMLKNNLTLGYTNNTGGSKNEKAHSSDRLS